MKKDEGMQKKNVPQYKGEKNKVAVWVGRE